MKKRMAAALMGALMVIGTVMPAGAEGNNTMTVEYTKKSSYTLSIPARVTLSETAEVSEQVGVSAINVSKAEKVQIKVKSGITEGAVTLTELTDSSITCSSTVSLLPGGSGIAVGDVVAEFTGSSTKPISGGTLYFSALGSNIQAGTYQGTIVFEASIVPSSASTGGSDAGGIAAAEPTE